MLKNLPVLGFTLSSKWLWVDIKTPDFSIITQSLRPRLLPRLCTNDYGDISTLRYITTITWFFHLYIGYGKPTSVEVMEDV